MKGQAVARILFVITLIVTAHTIRPFSMKNLTSHLLYSTRSFAVVLPDSTRSSFDYANTLAVALSQSMFVDAADVQTPSIPRTNFTAMAKAAPILEPQDVVEIEPVVKTGVSKSVAVKRVKPVVKSTWADTPADNTIAEVSNTESEANLTESTDDSTPAEESTVAEAVPADDEAEAQPDGSSPARAFTAAAPANPIVLPVNQLNVNCALSKVRPIQLQLPRVEIVRTDFKLITFWGQVKKPDCDQREVSHIRLIAVIEPPRKPKREKSVNSIQECEDEGKTEVIEAEAVGPHDEASEFEAENMKIAPLIPTNPVNPESCNSQK